MLQQHRGLLDAAQEKPKLVQIIKLARTDMTLLCEVLLYINGFNSCFLCTTEEKKITFKEIYIYIYLAAIFPALVKSLSTLKDI